MVVCPIGYRPICSLPTLKSDKLHTCHIRGHWLPSDPTTMSDPMSIDPTTMNPTTTTEVRLFLISPDFVSEFLGFLGNPILGQTYKVHLV